MSESCSRAHHQSTLCPSVQGWPAGLWGLDDQEDPYTQRVLQQAQQEPDAYVLKPQREGGGNNLYGEKLLEKLQGREGLAAYILMQRIRPPIQPCAPSALADGHHAFMEPFLAGLAVSCQATMMVERHCTHD